MSPRRSFLLIRIHSMSSALPAFFNNMVFRSRVDVDAVCLLAQAKRKRGGLMFCCCLEIFLVISANPRRVQPVCCCGPVNIDRQRRSLHGPVTVLYCVAAYHRLEAVGAFKCSWGLHGTALYNTCRCTVDRTARRSSVVASGRPACTSSATTGRSARTTKSRRSTPRVGRARGAPAMRPGARTACVTVAAVRRVLSVCVLRSATTARRSTRRRVAVNVLLVAYYIAVPHTSP